MSVRTDDRRSVSFDLKDYDRIDHGYAATIHKAQGMTVDRTHVLATPGLDAHGSYVALSRHRDGMDLHYGRDDFADEDQACPHPVAGPGQGYGDGLRARRSGAGLCRAARNQLPRAWSECRDRREGVPEKVRGMFDGLRRPAEGGQESGHGRRRKGGMAEDPEEALARPAPRCSSVMPAPCMRSSRFRNRAAGPARSRWRNCRKPARAFEEVRPYGSHDAEAAYKKNPELAQEAATGRVNRAIRALQLETELRTDPQTRADRFVERWRSLDRASQHQYQAGDMSGYKSTRSAMSDMAKSLERDPQLEFILEGRKRDLGIGIDSGRRLGLELAFNHGIDLGRGRGIGL